jgi:uncharacterized protein YbjT (DUF2867 family)
MDGKTIFLTGATGFVGSAVLDELLGRGHRVHALVRKGKIDREGVTTFVGDLFDDAVLDAAMAGCAAVIHLVGIIREDAANQQTFERMHVEGSKRVIDAAKRNGIARFIHMSALGVRENSPSDYASTKARAEAYLKQCSLDYTILRPSVIHGPKGEFTRMLADWSFGRSFPYFAMPYFGRGAFGLDAAKLQPIYVGDVARCFADCLARPDLIGKTLDLGGPEQMTWPDLYATASHVLTGKAKLAMGFPTWYARLITQVAPASWLPFNRAQVEMAGEDNTTYADAVQNAFGFLPRRFSDSLREYADQLK